MHQHLTMEQAAEIWNARVVESVGAWESAAHVFLVEFTVAIFITSAVWLLAARYCRRQIAEIRQEVTEKLERWGADEH